MEDKLKVDAIIGLNLGEMYGKYRVYYKTLQELDSYVDYKTISYVECNWKQVFPYKNVLYDSFIYPMQVQKSIRKSVDCVHIFSQEEAYLLKSLKNNIPKVVTCLDIIPFIFREKFKLSLYARFIKSVRGMENIDERKFREYLKEADKIMTISEHTKADLIKYIKIPPEKITTVYLGVDEQFKRLSYEEISKVKIKYGLPENFILYLGSEQPRKNFTLLIKSFYKLIKKCGQTEIKLVKVGRPQITDLERKKIVDTIKKLNLEKNIIFIDYIPEKDLTAVYNAADIFVYPSIYEGFGLPPLEAMACGCPVITSNTSSLPEIVGDAGIMVDPHDVDGLTEAMLKLLTNVGLRTELKRRGLERSRKFSWKKTGRETLRVYNELIYR